MRTGFCKFCKQPRLVDTETNDEEIINDLATEQCDCPGALRKRKMDEERSRACEIIENLFEESNPEAAELLKSAIEPIQKEKIKNISIQVCSKIKASITKTTKDSLRVTRTFTKKDEMETE